MLKVRIIADLEARVAAEMAREGLSQSPGPGAAAQRTTTSAASGPRAFTGGPLGRLALRPGYTHHQLTVDDAVDFIVQAAGKECFQTTPEAQRKMDDLALACRVKAAWSRRTAWTWR